MTLGGCLTIETKAMYSGIALVNDAAATMTIPNLDDSNAHAVRVLAEAVRRERVPGIVEFVILADALNRALANDDLDELERGSNAFHALDPEYRRRIADRAQILARTEPRISAETLRATDPALRAVKPGRVSPPRSASGFLSALNHGRTAPSGSRSVAMARLLSETGGGTARTGEAAQASNAPLPPRWWDAAE